MKKVVFLLYLALPIFLPALVCGMDEAKQKALDAADKAVTLSRSRGEDPSEESLLDVISAGADYFTSKTPGKNVVLAEYLFFHTRVKPALVALLAQRAKRTGGTKPVDTTSLSAEFTKAVEQARDDDTDSLKRVVTLGRQLLVLREIRDTKDPAFREIHDQVKAAGNALRGNAKLKK